MEDFLYFTERHGVLLTHKELQLFTVAYGDNYEVMWHLRELFSKSPVAQLPFQTATTISKTQQKNRRYQYLQKLMETGDFFSSENMKIRDPLLWHQYIGKHQKEGEISNKRSGTSLSERIMMRAELENADEEIKEAEEVEEEEEDSDSEEDNNNNASDTPMPDKDYEYFLFLMQQRFLDGKELEFNYEEIDTDTSLDNIQQMERDAQDKYFSDEE
jgi:hypothetical protein